MGRRKRDHGRRQDSDYDGAWKESLRLHFREMLEEYFPTIAAAIDWSVPAQWRDKELSQILARAGRRPGRADLLAGVRLSNGEEQWILLHVEVQSGREAGFEVRVARYHGGFSWIFQRRVVSLVEELSRKFVEELTALEEGLNMPYVTSVERIAEARGRAEGRAEGEVEGSVNILLRMLARVCGPLPGEVEQRVRRLPVQHLETLAEAVLDFRSVDDVRVWLDAHEAPPQ